MTAEVEIDRLRGALKFMLDCVDCGIFPKPGEVAAFKKLVNEEDKDEQQVLNT